MDYIGYFPLLKFPTYCSVSEGLTVGTGGTPGILGGGVPPGSPNPDHISD